MKAIKISLVIIVFSGILFFVIRSFVTTPEVGKIRRTENRFIYKIQKEIEELKLKPENAFCKEYYIEIAYNIDDYYKNEKFSKNPIDNEQWKENLSKQLYVSYVDKFIKQAYYVFNRSDWRSSDLLFIRSEYVALQSSPMLERGSQFDRKFNDLKEIFNKYDEITAFISSCIGFSYYNTSLNMQFPIDDVKSRISRAKGYLNNGFENSYLNNCTRLHIELKEVPKSLFNAHVRYLDNMINSWSNMFADYSSQKAYAIGLYSLVEGKIDELDNNVYNVSNFDIEYARLKEKWQADGTKAYDHFNPE